MVLVTTQQHSEINQREIDVVWWYPKGAQSSYLLLNGQLSNPPHFAVGNFVFVLLSWTGGVSETVVGLFT
jgi:hypothetical protein